jgi:hypothetical protein
MFCSSVLCPAKQGQGRTYCVERVDADLDWRLEAVWPLVATQDAAMSLKLAENCGLTDKMEIISVVLGLGRCLLY